MSPTICLVGGLEHDFYDFPYIGNVVTPTDFHIFQRGRAQPPTRFNRSIHGDKTRGAFTVRMAVSWPMMVKPLRIFQRHDKIVFDPKQEPKHVVKIEPFFAEDLWTP